MDKTADFWNKLSKTYDKQVQSKYSQAYHLTVERTIKYLKDTDFVLDLACGTGIITAQLAGSVKDIYAIDISDSMIDIAKEKMKSKGIHNVRCVTSDLVHETIKEKTYDVVLAFNLLYFVKNIDEVLERINQTLKSGGLFISVTDCLGEKRSILNYFQSFLSKVGILPYIRNYKMKELEDIITNAGFSILETANFYTNPPNYFVVGKKK